MTDFTDAFCASTEELHNFSLLIFNVLYYINKFSGVEPSLLF